MNDDHTTLRFAVNLRPGDRVRPKLSPPSRPFNALMLEAFAGVAE